MRTLTPLSRTDVDRFEIILRDRVAALNEALGYSDTAWDAIRVTVGYVGNCAMTQDADGFPAYDDRRWYVFLPHPGRVGTDEDRLTWGWATRDADGWQRAIDTATAATRVARLARRL